MTISQKANDALSRAVQSVVGGLVNTSRLTRMATILNGDPQSVQIDQITITAANDATFTITINDISVSFTADSTATAPEIRDGLIAAVNTEAGIRGQVAAEFEDTNQLNLSGLTPGLPFLLEVSSTAGLLAVASQQTAEVAAAVPFGRLVVDDGVSPYSNDRLGRIAKSTAFVNQQTRVGIAFVASATYLVTIRDEAGNVLAQGETDATVSTIATIAAIAVTMNGLLPASSVLAIGLTDHIFFLSTPAGQEFSVEIGTNEAGQVGGAITGGTFSQVGPDETTSVNRAALGLSVFSSNDVDEYAGNDGMRVLEAGNSLWVESPDASISTGDPVFVELAVGDDSGKLFATDSATRVRLLGATWDRDGVTAAEISAVRADF